jgi:5-methylcytosine-specific restriction endonuclease McrA
VYMRQCLTCGLAVGQAIARAKVEGRPPPFDDLLAEAHKQQRLRRRDDLQQQRAAFFSWYREYLQSEAWHKKRAEVLRRDRHICQGCFGPAEQVHHLTYEHVGAELLFELISVCGNCHSRLHEPGRGPRP